jgi:endoglucanase
MPAIGNIQLKLLEKLCNASSVSGDEGEVRGIVLAELKKHVEAVKVDTLGNVFVRCTGSGSKRLRVMLSAHMDEVGFMLVGNDGEGLYRFEIVGGIDERQLPGKSVLVGHEKIPGVIGAKPIHFSSSEDLKHKVPLEDLRIDIGPGETGVKLGDRATFATRFQRNGSVIMAKALDNRLGVLTLLELVKNSPPNIDLFAAFTVQEEIGMRGAKVAAFTFNPDLGIAVDSTPALDLPDWDGEENTSYNTKLGMGPAIYVADNDTLSDPRLVCWMVDSGKASGIPYQIRQPGSGGTDAGAIHRARSGIPSLSVSIPHRYSHTAVSIAWLDDLRNTYALLHAALLQLNPALLHSERA